MKDKDGNMCKYVSDKVLLDKRLSPTAKTFYLIMCRFPPFSCADINVWAQACGISKYQAMKVFNELINAGHITKNTVKISLPVAVDSFTNYMNIVPVMKIFTGFSI